MARQEEATGVWMKKLAETSSSEESRTAVARVYSSDALKPSHMYQSGAQILLPHLCTVEGEIVEELQPKLNVHKMAILDPSNPTVCEWWYHVSIIANGPDLKVKIGIEEGAGSRTSLDKLTVIPATLRDIVSTERPLPPDVVDYAFQGLDPEKYSATDESFHPRPNGLPRHERHTSVLPRNEEETARSAARKRTRFGSEMPARMERRVRPSAPSFTE